MPSGSGSEDEAIRHVRWVLLSDPCPQKRQTGEAPGAHRGEGPWSLDLGAHELRTPREELGVGEWADSPSHQRGRCNCLSS